MPEHGCGIVEVSGVWIEARHAAEMFSKELTRRGNEIALLRVYICVCMIHCFSTVQI